MALSLVVEDFLIKQHKEEDADHLLAALREKYVITTDTAKTMKYVGITIKYNKVKHIITLSMPDYITKALKRFGKEHVKGTDSPLIYVPPHYGAKTQLAASEDESAPLSAKEIKEVREIVGVFLFYARVVDPTMVTPISKIASKQAKPIQMLQSKSLGSYNTLANGEMLC